MVGRIRRVLGRSARASTLALVRAVLKFFTGESRAVLIQELAESAFATDKSAALNAFVGQVSQGAWTQAERESLFIHSCNLFDAVSTSDRIIEHFERVCGGALHYSQEGEDVVLARLLGAKSNGFFVDIGAHHATRFSNTYSLYRRGWRGLNIDATPGSMESFSRIRPEDINLEMAISDRKEPLVFSLFKEGALNTFDRQLAQNYIKDGWELTGTLELVPQTLAEVLEQHLEAGQKIDLMSVDVEGEDLRVLKSNDWSKYCPEIVIIEALDTPLACLDENPVVVFLKEQGLVPASRLFNSIIFKRVAGACAAF
jgi:FkbM family methyltransferase